VFRAVGNALPFAHAIDASRAVMVDGAGAGEIAGDLYWMLGYALGTIVAAVALFRRRMLE
jgi:hypothetical protein